MSQRALQFRIWDKKQCCYLPHASTLIPPEGILAQRDDSDYVYEQFAGCSDYYGKPIYEGDIVAYPAVTGDNRAWGHIIFYYGAFIAKALFKSDQTIAKHYSLVDLRIVGNVHSGAYNEVETT